MVEYKKGVHVIVNDKADSSYYGEGAIGEMVQPDDEDGVLVRFCSGEFMPCDDSSWWVGLEELDYLNEEDKPEPTATITITQAEYDRLKEIEWMYNNLCD